MAEPRLRAPLLEDEWFSEAFFRTVFRNSAALFDSPHAAATRAPCGRPETHLSAMGFWRRKQRTSDVDDASTPAVIESPTQATRTCVGRCCGVWVLIV